MWPDRPGVNEVTYSNQFSVILSRFQGHWQDWQKVHTNKYMIKQLLTVHLRNAPLFYLHTVTYINGMGKFYKICFYVPNNMVQ